MLRRTSRRQSSVAPISSGSPLVGFHWSLLSILRFTNWASNYFGCIMTQHEILMLISAPLLVLGRPMIAFLWALAPALRDKAAGLGRSRTFKKGWCLCFGPALGMVGFSAGVVDLAYSLAIRSNPAQQLDSRGPTYDIPGDSAGLLVAGGEPGAGSRLWRRSCVCLHDNFAYQRPRSFAYVRTAGLVLVLRDDCSCVAPECARRSTDRRTHHVDSRRDTAAHCCFSFAGQVDERIADQMAVHTHG